MKKLITLLLIAVFSSAYAQAPQGFNYQAVARDAAGVALTNQAVGVQIAILQGSAVGASVYTETHSVTSNNIGLLNLVVGNGSVVAGTFSGINWANGPYFIEISMDVTGGTSYVLMGAQQLMSVPYALYALNAGTSGPQGATGATGPQGATGNDGAQGATGNNGVDGVTGSTGAQGVTGNNGVDGATGVDGLIGPTGATGSAGTNGTNGATGVTGPQGVAGVNGINGATGNTGATGTNGTNGTNGATGSTGATGPQGVTGNNGVDGATGVDGLIGPTGATGSAGTNGTNGATGATGPQGVAGVNGINGATGSTGATGAQGAQGVQGPQGITGATGVAGTNGTDGATGSIGATGDANISGTTNYVMKFTGATTGGNSLVFDNGTSIGIGTVSPVDKFHVVGGGARIENASPSLTLDHTGFSQMSRLYFRDTFGSGRGDIFWSQTNGLSFTANGYGEVMRMLSNGNVGIGTSTPSSTLTTIGSQSVNIVTSALGSITLTNTDYVLVKTGAGATVVNLPQASTCSGRVYKIAKAASTGNLTIDAFGSELVDGAITLVLNSAVSVGVEIISNGTQWYVISKF